MLRNPFIEVKREFIPVDLWEPDPSELVFHTANNVFIAPVSKFYNADYPALDYFRLSTKRCYNSIKNRTIVTHYLNYFAKFYDNDNELIAIYSNLKYLIDYQAGYDKTAFFNDINKYILRSSSMMQKIHFMNTDNYILLRNKNRSKDPNLQYTNKHGILLNKIGLIMKICVPLLTHFAYVNKIKNIQPYLLEIYNVILDMFDVNLYNKIYETASSIVDNSANKNPLWHIQDIRGVSASTHALSSIECIILNIMFKYVYSGSAIYLNLKSIRDSINHQVLGIEYDHTYVEHSSSKRDMDSNSEFDRFESYLTKQDESLFIYNTVNCDKTLENLLLQYGDFSQDEVKRFTKRLMGDNTEFVINNFQKELIFYVFYKYFGDPVSLDALIKDNYIKLMMLARKILLESGLVTLPYILSSRIVRLNTRSSLNKKESTKLHASPYYIIIKNKYRSEKIEKEIEGLIATIISSEFEIIDLDNPDIDGKILRPLDDAICEELSIFIKLI